jgi:heme oxygenase
MESRCDLAGKRMGFLSCDEGSLLGLAFCFLGLSGLRFAL